MCKRDLELPFRTMLPLHVVCGGEQFPFMYHPYCVWLPSSTVGESLAETGMVFEHIDCLNEYILFLDKLLLFMQGQYGAHENQYHKRECRVDTVWMFHGLLKNASAGACFSCCSSPVL